MRLLALSRRNFGSSRIGFVGLGQMGAPMAKNLLAMGERVIVYDKSAEAMEGFISKASSLKDLACQSDVIFTMLPNGEIVENTYLGSDGLLSSIKEKTILVDCSTIEHQKTRELSSKLAQKNIDMIDAPVSGGIMGAQNATLTFMVGGSEVITKKLDHIFMKMGKKVLKCGPVGSGQIAKACNNMMLGISMAGLSEALVLGEKLGLDLKILSEVINSSSGRSWASELYNPVPGVIQSSPASRQYAPGFSCNLLLKDLNLAIGSARKVDLDLRVAEKTLEYYNAVCKKENQGGKDFSVLFQEIRN